MMIDWLVVLAPLAALPVVLLLVFVGCSLDPYGDVPTVGVTLQFLNLADIVDVLSLKITMGYTLNTGESPTNLRGGIVLTSLDLVTAFIYSGNSVDLTPIMNLTGQPDGELDCWGYVTLVESPATTIMAPPPAAAPAQVYMSPNSGDGAVFTLIRGGNDFDLIGETGYVAFEGG